MRTPLGFSIFLALALTLSACSIAPVAPGQFSRVGQAQGTSASQSTEQSGASTTLRLVAQDSSDQNTAIQAVIKQANEEQQQAFAQNDPTIMQDTATSDYYNQMVQINSDMANSGISAIKLANIDWGQITLRDETTAEATTYETWQTYLSDGSMVESRDTNVYTLVQDQGTWKIQTDDHPDANPNQGPSVSTPKPSQQVPPDSLVPAGHSGISPNWSGYAASNGAYTAVSGTWTVPQASGTGNFASGATWVGIGGVNSRDLIQSGTGETSDRSGSVRYEAWIETLPGPSQTIPLTVTPGDSVTVSLSEQQANNWLIAFKNNTTGQSYQTTVQYASSQSSAEWVEEAPSTGRQILPLDNFGTVQFSNGSTTVNGKSLTIAQAGAQPITMFNSQGNAIAAPTTLTADGQGFSVSRTTSSATAQPRSGGGGLPARPRRSHGG